jgi:LPS sulfotransferase NodH
MTPSDTRPNRYLVTGLPRSGTNLILHTLSVHPQVLAYNELFNPDRVLWGSSAADEEIGDAFLEFRRKHPLQFLEYVLTPDYPGIRAVGFKLFYMQALPEEHQTYRLVWPWLRRMRGLKVVDVVRKNRLKQIFSWFLATETKIWLRMGADQPQSPTSLAIPFDTMHGYFHWFDDMEKLRASQLRGLDVLTLTYEELSEDFALCMERIQVHLGVPVLPLSPVTRKQRTAHISEVLSNYRELRDRFARTPYLRYFEMAEASAHCSKAVM